MHSINDIFNDVRLELGKSEHLNNLSFHHFADRHFSIIYEVHGLKEQNEAVYVLKISTTDRTCKNEFEQYEFLHRLGIRTLIPVLHSQKFNYLITKKESLTRFDTHIKNQNNIHVKANCFYSLGRFFKDLENKTGKDSFFCRHHYNDYVLPRIESSKQISLIDKRFFLGTISQTTERLHGMEIRNCFISDFSLGNINYDSKNKILILDMGDAGTGNRYDNISYMYLMTRLGSLNQYTNNERTSRRFFSEYLKGYEISELESTQLSLYKIKHLINMITFVSEYESSTQDAVRKIVSMASNKYLIYRYMNFIRNSIAELK